MDVDLQIPDHAARALRAATHPVACARMYGRMVDAIFEKLFGLSSAERTKKMHSPVEIRKKGLFGTPVAFYGITQAQARGALHLHTLLWGGLHGAALELSAHIPALERAIGDTMDSIVSGRFPVDVYEAGRADREAGRPF